MNVPATVVCWDCIKGRHLLCVGTIPTTDTDTENHGKQCECPECHTTLTVGTRVRITAPIDMINGVTGTVTGVKDGDGTDIYHVRMDRSWAELGSVNPCFQGNTMWAEKSALQVIA